MRLEKRAYREGKTQILCSLRNLKTPTANLYFWSIDQRGVLLKKVLTALFIPPRRDPRQKLWLAGNLPSTLYHASVVQR